MNWKQKWTEKTNTENEKKNTEMNQKNKQKPKKQTNINIPVFGGSAGFAGAGPLGGPAAGVETAGAGVLPGAGAAKNGKRKHKKK